jgi:hypothetical protein
VEGAIDPHGVAHTIRQLLTDDDRLRGFVGSRNIGVVA